MPKVQINLQESTFRALERQARGMKLSELKWEILEAHSTDAEGADCRSVDHQGGAPRNKRLEAHSTDAEGALMYLLDANAWTAYLKGNQTVHHRPQVEGRRSLSHRPHATSPWESDS